MKHLFQRGLLLLAFILGLAFHLTAQSTLMTIHMNDGTERNYYMSEDDRVYFEGNDILVVEIAFNAKSERYNLADIRTARLPQRQKCPLCLFQSFRQQPQLRRLPAAVTTLKGNQNASVRMCHGMLSVQKRPLPLIIPNVMQPN